MANEYVVRYGQMRFLGEYTGLDGQEHPRGQRVVVRSDRGTELGEVLCPATDRDGAVPGEPGPGRDPPACLGRGPAAKEPGWPSARRTASPPAASSSPGAGSRWTWSTSRRSSAGERMVFYYLAEKRVDFRELVKDLARAFQTRIEMRQIGVRDEAKLLADYGDCGKPVCCNTHLSRMPPVSMRMAKIQKTTLDPSKISGRCGRLKCCLRYEFDTYQALEQDLPAVGSRVVTREGRAGSWLWKSSPRRWSSSSKTAAGSSSAPTRSSASRKSKAATPQGGGRRRCCEREVRIGPRKQEGQHYEPSR